MTPTRDPARIRELLWLLDALPYRTLRLDEVTATVDALDRIEEVLTTGRRLSPDGTGSEQLDRLHRAWQTQMQRVARLDGRAAAVAGAWQRLEARWFDRHPGKRLDERPHLALVTGTPLNSGFLRGDALIVVDDLAVNTGTILSTGTDYRLAPCPGWLVGLLVADADSLTFTVDTVALTEPVDPSELDDTLFALAALWTADPDADLYDLRAVLEAWDRLTADERPSHPLLRHTDVTYVP